MAESNGLGTGGQWPQCRWCGELVSVTGPRFIGKAVHAGTGHERCADGNRLAAPLDLAVAS